MTAKKHYTLSIWYDTFDEGAKCYTMHNLDRATFYQVRNEIFSMGMALKNPDDPTEGQIVPPHRIIHIKWYQQEKFFPGATPGFNKKMEKSK